MTLSELRALVGNRNVAAFLRVIRERESSQDDSAYTVMNGGAHFSDFSRHPFEGQRTPPAKASGAYQFIASTWGDVERQYAMPDFSPASQDAGAVARLIYRKALDDVLAGRFEEAVAKCRLEWTSLPGASESSGSWTMDKARAVFLKYGGTLAGTRPAREGAAGATLPTPGAGQPTQREGARTMGGLAAAGMIGQLLQTVVQAFAPAARAKVEQAVSAAGPEGASAIADGLLGVVRQVTGLTDPIQAVAAVTAPNATAQAMLADVETGAVLKLDELAGFLDRIAKLEDAAAARVETARASARAFTTPEVWRLRWAQASFTQRTLGYAVIVIAVLIACMQISLPWLDSAIAIGTQGLIGQLVVLEVSLITGLVSTFRDQNGFSYGGTADTNAGDIARDELAARRAASAK